MNDIGAAATHSERQLAELLWSASEPVDWSSPAGRYLVGRLSGASVDAESVRQITAGDWPTGTDGVPATPGGVNHFVVFPLTSSGVLTGVTVEGVADGGGLPEPRVSRTIGDGALRIVVGDGELVALLLSSNLDALAASAVAETGAARRIRASGVKSRPSDRSRLVVGWDVVTLIAATSGLVAAVPRDLMASEAEDLTDDGWSVYVAATANIEREADARTGWKATILEIDDPDAGDYINYVERWRRTYDNGEVETTEEDDIEQMIFSVFGDATSVTVNAPTRPLAGTQAEVTLRGHRNGLRASNA